MIVNWLHLSDWHQKDKGLDRKVIAETLIDDIRARKKIGEPLDQIRFIIFSGDISFSGEREEFETANSLLIDPVRKELGPGVPIFYVPGNHDVQRAKIPADWSETLTGMPARPGDIEDIVAAGAKMEILNGPLENFYQFAERHDCQFDRRKLHRTTILDAGEGKKISIVCLNTTWLSARFALESKKPDKTPWDRGLLRMTESQIRDAIKPSLGTDLVIAVMHHPLHWLDEMEQAKAEQLIGRDCHVVLHGHEHRPNMNRLSNAFGDVVIIPAGASYNRRIAGDPRYTNAYNFCSVNLDSNVGTIYHRLWSEETNEWIADERFWAKGRSLFFIQKKQPFEQQKIARAALNQLSRNYLPSVYLRPVMSQEIVLAHKVRVIGGETFIQAKVRIRIRFHAGDPEKFPIGSQFNSRIESHPDPEVRAAAYQLKKPREADLDWKRDGIQHRGYFELGPRQQLIEYEYEMLETTDGLYYFNLRRFTDKVTFELFKAPELMYEDLPFGGFPSGHPVNDDFSNSHIWETDQLAMPNQGLVLQWYPKPLHAAPDVVPAAAAVEPADAM